MIKNCMSFKLDDKVVTKGGISGTIVDLDYTSNMFQIAFDDKDLIPPMMWYPAEYLKLVQDSTEGRCPLCLSEWHIVKFNMHVWKDCLKCCKKEEDILKEIE